MRVLISDAKSGKVVADIPLTLLGANYSPTEKEHFDEGWKCAVEDKSVDPQKRAEYAFNLVT